MARNRKIKTYKKIYSEPNGPFSSPLGVVAMALGLVLVTIIGWSAYGPVYHFVMGIGEKSSEASSPSGAVSDPGDASGASVSGVDGDDTAAPPQPAGIDSLRAVYMPAQYASDLNRVDAFLNALPAGSYDTVIVDVKDSSGKIYYKSAVELAVKAEAVATQALDASVLSARIRGAGYRPAARLHAFSDHMVSAYDWKAAVMYMNTDWTWLDNSAELGGKPWLSPYSDTAQNYVIDIASELAQGGFEFILVDSVHFPTGVGIEKAGYGEAGQRTSRLDQLKAFANRMAQAVERAGGQCALYIPATSILSPSDLIYGGNPLDIHSGTVVVGMMPGTLLAGSNIGGTVVANPMGDPAGTVSALFGLVPEAAHGRTVAWLQGYNADGTAAETSFVAAQVRGVPGDAQGYIVYNPQGSYKK